MHEIAMKIRRSAEATIGINPDTKHYIGAAVARGLATVLTLPTSPVAQGSLRPWYHENNGAMVAQVLSEINEVLVIDVREVEQLTYKLFCLRYDLVHQPDEDRAIRLRQFLSISDEDMIPPRTREVFMKAGQEGDVEMAGRMPSLMRSIIRTLGDALAPTPAGDKSEG